MMMARLIIAVALCWAALALPIRAEPPADMTPLLAIQKSLAGTTNVQSDFIQEKTLSMLQRTVVIKGRLTVQQPDWFSWRVTEPVKYNLILKGAALSQWDETTGSIQKMSLAGNPVFGVVATQLRAWFTGQFDSLLKDFDAEIEAQAPALRIAFIPRAGSFAAKAIRRVTLTFREDGRYLQDMAIDELSGDRTRMTFTNTVLNATIDPRAWEVAPDVR
jgi:outer membrane lipoprotein-sorting protein